ncbi:MAG: hypothetical protein AABY22_23460 [Nanoarchaeota archaeon]
MSKQCFISKKVNGKERVYELTTNGKDGFSKWMVRGITDDDCARKVAKKAFGKYYSKSLISYYDDYPSEHKTDWSKAPTINEFLKKTKVYRK